ncbi:MAG TPA: hypothetical protein PKU98_12525, partial [Saprospiraceae bacterium]|nr:hypothetical protein [Saprospiraceae bacterium]
MKRLYIMMCLTVFLPMLLTAQQQAEEKGNLLSTLEKFSLSGYGAMNYYNFDWQTDTAKRNAIDNERFILDLDYHWTPRISLSTEIEFEHGGTGVDVEFDRFEEFGEFEYEVSKGGEIKIEQMNLQFDITEGIKFELGR